MERQELRELIFVTVPACRKQQCNKMVHPPTFSLRVFKLSGLGVARRRVIFFAGPPSLARIVNAHAPQDENPVLPPD